MGSMSWVHWAIVLLIVLLVFGTKRLRGAGQDLGEAVKGFKKGMHGDEKPVETLTAADPLADARREAAARDAIDPARRDPAAAPRAGDAGYDDRTPRA